jgi:two-component system response regulator AtoC
MCDPGKRIFVLDDEPQIGDLFVTVLRRDGFDSRAFVNPHRLLEHLDEGETPDVILADLMMPGMNGIELLEALKERNVTAPVIIMTGHSSVQTAVEALHRGAFHYLQKPVNLEETRTTIREALRRDAAPCKVAGPQPTLPRPGKHVSSDPPRLLGESDAIERVRQTIETLRNVPNTIVLIVGETGTGKNLVANTIHYNSTYNAGRFMEINCAALPDNLLEAELFGYEKGAFTDAREAKPGLLEVADGGTVFLDEIDSMSPSLQAKLLSFLESRTFRRLGGVEDIRVTTRIICATNAELEEKVAKKEFRKDLYFRINVVKIYMPPLRQMGEDVLKLALSVVGEFNRELKRQVRGFTTSARQRLVEHKWPGTVRELRNVLERAMIFTQGDYIDALDLATAPKVADACPATPSLHDDFAFPAGLPLEELEKAYLHHLFQSTDATYKEVAHTLGITRKTLREKRRKYRLDQAFAA